VKKTITGRLVNASIIDATKNQWELTLMIDDELANVEKYKVQSKYPFRNDEIRRFKLTFKGDKVIRVEALD
jgi:hypothetical protein